MKKISDWEIEKLSAQVVFPRLNIFDYLINNEYKQSIEALVIKGVGGFCVFGGNIEDNIKVINELQMIADVPLLFAGDFENGLSMRLSEGTEFPHAMALAKTKSTETTRNTAKMIAMEAKAIGVHWNFAPVADINNNPNNPVINIRSFGENTELVSAHTTAYIDGCQSEKVLACAKHFPGHGDTQINSHLSLPELNFTLKQLRQRELLPFIGAIAADVHSIMLGHLSLPLITNSNLPASFSKIIVTDLLKNELNFKGLIVTDALEMNAICNNFTTNQIAKLTIEAGVNVLLMPQNEIAIIDELQSLSFENEEFKTKLIQSVEKIIQEKRWTGLIPQYVHQDLPKNLFTAHPYKALKYSSKALQIIDPDNLIPLKDINRISVFALLNNSNDFDKATKFVKMLSEATDFEIDFAYLDSQIQQEYLDKFKEESTESDLVIFPIFLKNSTYASSVSLPPAFKWIIEELSANKKSISILFGSPYYSNEIKSNSKILTFSDAYSSLAAVVVKLTNRNLDWIEE
jgi:beta-glucosidase-like glycosyl hydrolase